MTDYVCTILTEYHRAITDFYMNDGGNIWCEEKLDAVIVANELRKMGMDVMIIEIPGMGFNAFQVRLK